MNGAAIMQDKAAFVKRCQGLKSLLATPRTASK